MTRSDHTFDLQKSASSIKYLQYKNGAIPEWRGPNENIHIWNHIECCMALTTAGFFKEAKKGFDYVVQLQQPDGSFYTEPNKKNNFIEIHLMAYVLVGLWHYYLCTHDDHYLAIHWEFIKKLMNFLSQAQDVSGAFYWGQSEGKWHEEFLLTANSSIYKSIYCAIKIAQLLNSNCEGWINALKNLQQTINYPKSFWSNKENFAMDWFYPALTGFMNDNKLSSHIFLHWDDFVIDGVGCKCVREKPWVTVAETAELIMACCRANCIEQAHQLFNWIGQFQHTDHQFWMGYHTNLAIYWPTVFPTWTTAAMVLAYDTLYQVSNGCQLFLAKDKRLDYEKEYTVV